MVFQKGLQRTIWSVMVLVLVMSQVCLSQESMIEPLTTFAWENVIDLAIVSPEQIWGVGLGGLLIVSEDGGANWTRPNLDRTPEWFNGVFFLDRLQGWIAGSEGSVFKTGDGGRTWDRTTIEGAYLTDILFLDGAIGLATGLDGLIFRTENGGHDWQRIQLAESVIVNKLCAVSVDVVVAVGGRGLVFRSQDRGISWQTVNTPTSVTLYDLSFVDEKQGWISGRNGIVLYSADGGSHWEERSVPYAEELNAICFLDQKTGLTAGGTIEKQNHIFYTRDGGLTWTGLIDPHHKWWKAIECFPGGTCLLAGNDLIARCSLREIVKRLKP
ncbi:hypothetical protein JXQ70_02185 [bacterium]|nr:hypothetical protein [bacterium]